MRLCRTRWCFLPLLAAVLLPAGCKPSASAPGDRVPPNPSAPARYGPPTGVASKEIPRALPPGRDTNWRSAPFWILHTELSPGLLVHSSTRYLGLFAELAEQGLGAPSHVAWSTKDGPRAFPPGETHDARGLEENWLLVWFAGATNWTNWDAPWAVFLQHRPTWLRLDERGLHLEFPASAGDVVVMPLYGYFKLPPPGRDYLAEHGMKSRELHSWTWEKALARDPLTRLRYWAGASRAFPIYCEETFSVDRARDELTVRSRFEWHAIDDDWKTRPVKLAPVSPVLALAARDKDFPARFSPSFHDMELPTPFGPYAGVQGADAFEVTFPWLHYINETEVMQPPDTNAHPLAARALAALREMARTNHFFADVVPWAGALPFLEQDAQTRVAGLLKEQLDQGHGLPVVPTWEHGGSGVASVPFQAGWAYAQFANEWETARREWPRWRGIGSRIHDPSWAGFARRAPSDPAEAAAQQAGLARLAYRMGDMDLYHFACFQFVQSCVHIWVAQRRAGYFMKHQPWDSMEWGTGEPAGTNLWSACKASTDLLGVNDSDVARFHRDWIREDVRRRLDRLQARWSKEVDTPDSHSIVRQLAFQRAGLLGESVPELAGQGVLAELAASGRPEHLTAILRASRPVRFERLIPPGEPSPFVTGGEREAKVPGPALLAHVRGGSAGSAVSPGWPRLEWPQWKSPAGGAWSFGAIKPVRDGQPASVQRQALNWNTEVLIYADFP